MFSKIYIALALILILYAMLLPNGKNMSKGWLGGDVKHIARNLKTAFQHLFHTNRKDY